MKCLLLGMALLSVACGFDVVDFDPHASTRTVEQLVVGEVPPDAIERLTARGKSKREPKLSLLAPEPEVVLPANVAPLEFHWREVKPGKPGAEASATVYELSLLTAARELRIYTQERSALPPRELWIALLSEPAAEPLTAQLRAVGSGPKGELLEGEPQTLHIAEALPSGSLYFESNAGLERARIADSEAVPLMLPMTACFGGHAISREGSKLGLACAEGAGIVCGLPDLTVLQTLTPEPGSKGFGAFDPSGTRYVRVRDGQLEIVELMSSAVQVLAPRALAEGARMDEPDWSADGKTIVFIYRTAMPTKPGQAGASIARVVLTEEWSEPQVLVTGAGPMSTLRAPRYTPDGSYIAYEEASGDAMNPPGLYLLPANGGIPMAIDGMTMKRAAKEADTLPTWLPSARAGHAWLAFSSTRDDGAEAAAMTQRLWLRHVDLTQLPAVDAVAPAFALPVQSAGSEPRRALFAAER